MGRGTTLRGESRCFRDDRTGARVRQVTACPALHHHPFYYVPAFDDAMRRLVFISHRTGRAEVWAEERESGDLVQLTDQPGVAEWSVHPSHDGRHVYYTTESGGWRVNAETLAAEQVLALDRHVGGMGAVGAAMGTTALSHDDRWWAVPVRDGQRSRLVVVDTHSGASEVIVEAESIGHPEFHPQDSGMLRYAGPYHARMWVIARDGSGHRLVYQRDAARKEWVVHETWRPGSRELVVTRWPHGMIGVDVDSGAVRQICSFNAWHAGINRRGTLLCADTTYPDRGLQLFDAQDGVGQPTTLCWSGSSNVGAHWSTDHCPYDDGPVQVYAPQHTHPHPSFSPDGSRVVFTSDRSGVAQVYEVEVPAEWQQR